MTWNIALRIWPECDIIHLHFMNILIQHVINYFEGVNTSIRLCVCVDVDGTLLWCKYTLDVFIDGPYE